MENKIREFTDLKCWQKGHWLAIKIYEATKLFPKSEQFGLTIQLRRATVSITSNIAEGFSRASFKDKSRFYSMALGSVTEVQNQLILARDLKYIHTDIFTELFNVSVEVNKIINGLIKKSNELSS